MVTKRRRSVRRYTRARERRLHYSTDLKILMGVFILLLVALWMLLFLAGMPAVALIILSIMTIVLLIVMWFFMSMKFVITGV